MFYTCFILVALSFMFEISAESSEEKIDCFIITSAKIIRSDPEKSKDGRSKEKFLQLANSGHQIKNGGLNIFAIRKFEDNGKGVDVQEFSKVTLELKDEISNLLIDDQKYFDVSRGYFSYGNVGFIHKGNYWLAHNPIRAIKIARTKNGMIATIKSKFIATNAADLTKKNMTIDVSCPVRLMKVKNLDSWEGAVGTGWDSFAPHR